MPIAQALHGAKGADELSLRGLLRDLKQLVRGAAKRTDDHDRLSFATLRDDCRRAPDCFLIADGSSPNLQTITRATPDWSQ
jgi:hypothetical protein